MRERMAFGPDLRRARERRGLSLEQIAERTKVAASLYAGLERNDLSRWPSGLFRRAFVRAYAEAVGLDPEDVCRRFVALFPEEGAAPGPALTSTADAPPAAPTSEAEQPRLTLAVPAPPVRATGRIWRRAAAAGVDVALAMVPAAIMSLLAGPGWFWLVTGAVGVTGHVLVLIVHGTTPGGWLLLGPRPIVSARHETPAAAPRRPEVVAGTAGPRR
ncbi:MAG: helix-turn-helix domain-containing protein, partial [Acidobacteria bacterium]